MKTLHIAIGVIFILFALVQYNDPDFYIWMPVYSVLAFLGFSKAFGRPQRKVAMALGILLLLWSGTYIPALIDWIKNGTPNIAGTMKAETPHIELIRELFGLVLSVIAAWYYWRKG